MEDVQQNQVYFENLVSHLSSMEYCPCYGEYVATLYENQMSILKQTEGVPGLAEGEVAFAWPRRAATTAKHRVMPTCPTFAV
jgi:hypothetical protein